MHFKNAELANHIIGKDADFAYGASKPVWRDAEFLRPEANLVVVMDVDTFPLTDALGLVVETWTARGRAA